VRPSLSSSLTGSAKSDYEGAKLLYEVKDFAGAETKYRAAYRASNDPRLLWNIAACEKELRHYAGAAALLERFIAEAPALVPAEFLVQARATLAALRSFYSPLRLTGAPAGTRVMVDGDEIGTAPLPAPIPVDLGKHVIRAERDGYRPYEAVLDVAGQGEVVVDIALKQLDAQLIVNPSDPSDVIAVDDGVVGSGRWEGSVTAGSHRVKVTAPRSKPYVADVDLAAGEHRSIDVSLERESAGRGALWPWIVSGAAVVVAGGVVGAYFALKPGSTSSAPPPGSAAMTIQLSSTHAGSVRSAR